MLIIQNKGTLAWKLNWLRRRKKDEKKAAPAVHRKHLGIILFVVLVLYLLARQASVGAQC